MSNVVVVGLGYVGLPLAVRAAEVGHEVLGVDVDPHKVRLLQSGTSYVEDVSEDRLRMLIGSGALRVAAGWDDPGDAQNPPATFDVGIIAVPTPLRGSEPDLSYVTAAGRLLGQALRPGAAVVLESTTYPGTTEQLLAPVLQDASGLVPGTDFHLGFSPERIDPGNEVFNLVNTPKLVSATTPRGLDVIRRFYDTIVDVTVPVSSPRVAELAELFENIQANVNIALINEVATLCHDLDVDVWEMIDASMTKGHSMAYWTPGPGVGGHCLPIDPLYLAWQAREQTGRPFRFAELAHEINKQRPTYVAERAAELFERQGDTIRGRNVLVLGVAYKPNVGDLRESPAVDVVQSLLALGAHVTVVDPHVTNWTLTEMLPFEDLGGRTDQYPLVIVVTDHREFDFDKIADRARLVLDCRNAMPQRTNVVRL